jgi:hypothetical protein
LQFLLEADSKMSTGSPQTVYVASEGSSGNNLNESVDLSIPLRNLGILSGVAFMISVHVKLKNKPDKWYDLATVEDLILEAKEIREKHKNLSVIQCCSEEFLTRFLEGWKAIRDIDDINCKPEALDRTKLSALVKDAAEKLGQLHTICLARLDYDRLHPEERPPPFNLKSMDPVLYAKCKAEMEMLLKYERESA